MSQSHLTASRILRIAGVLLTLLTVVTARAANGTPDEIIERARKASEQARAMHSGFRDQVDECNRLIELRTGRRGYSARIAEESEQLARLREERERLTRSFDELRARVESVRVASAAGHALRAARGAIPTTWERRRSVWRRERAMRDEEYRRFDLQDHEARLTDEFADEVERVVAGFGDPPMADVERLRQAAGELLTAKRELLGVLLVDSAQWLEMLVEADSLERELVGLTRDYRAYINERVLWLPVQPPLAAENALAVVEGARRIFTPSLWTHTGSALVGIVQERPVPVLALVTLVLSIAGARPILRRRLREATGGSGLASAGEALLHTLMIAAFLPLTALAGAWVLARAPGLPPLARSFGVALGLAIPFLAEIEVCRSLLQAGGIAERVAGWKPETVKSLASLFRRLAHLFVPVAILAVMLRVHSEEFRQAWSGRALPIAWLIAFWAFGYAVLRFRRSGRAAAAPAIVGWFLERPRLRRSVSFALGGVIAGAAMLIVLGYPHTAAEILRRLLDSATVALGGSLIWSFTSRSLLPQPGAAEATAGDAAFAARIRGLVVLAVVAGLGFVWSPVVPALRYLNTVQLWSVTTEGGVAIVTVASILWFIGILVGTVVLVRFVPGLVALLAPITAARDSGVGYAVSSLTQYVIVVVGTLAAFASIKIDWSQLKWLAAGFSVGLGFGLQEIVANFISGLILLFERPVLVGDTVTVGQTTGMVASINVRATTIRDADGKHLIVPNRDLITQPVHNWTFEGSVSRVTVNVGVAFGSDVDLVERLLLGIARQCPSVIEDPPPRVLFGRFGENALDFTLYVFVREVGESVDVRHFLHREIDREFRAAGVDIPFPQRDLHLDAGQPIPVHVVRGESAD